MRTLTEGTSLDDFFDRLREAHHPLLLLDYDGTLAPFREDRNRAVPYEGVRRVVDAILEDGRTRVVMISGRPVEDVVNLAGLQHPVEVWGTHGWERLRSDGSYAPPQLGDTIEQALDQAAAFLVEEMEAPERCEQKPASVAFHVRSIPEDRAEQEVQRVRDAWSRLLDDRPLEIEPFDGGIELRVSGQNKGDAVNSILAEEDELEVAAYLGDDLTDEDAFRALEGRGLRVLVREEYRETAADLWLQPPDELVEFLGAWEDSVQGSTKQ